MIFKRFRALFLLATVFAVVFAFVSVQKSSANAPSPAITTPCGIGARGPLLEWTRDCMTIKIIDRAHVEVKLKDGDKQAVPDSASGTTLGQRIGGIYTLSPDPTAQFDGLASPLLYCAPNLACHGPIIRLGLNPGPLYSLPDKLDPRASFNNFQMFVGGLSNNDNNPNLPQIWGGNVCQGGATDEMVGIQPIGSGAHWNCDDSDAAGRSAKQMAYDIGNAIIGLGVNNVTPESFDAFNVTMRASADGNQLSSVFDGPGTMMQNAAKESTFTFCGVSGKYSINCNDPTANFISGKKPDDFKGKTTTEVTIQAAKGGQGLTAVVAQSDNPNNGAGGGNNTHNGQATCNGGSLGWLLCSAIDALQDLTKQIAGFAEPLLIIRLDNVPSLDAAQKNVTNLANVALIIFFLFIIFSQSTSIGLSTYGIKKKALQLVVISILVQIAGPVVKFMTDFSNIAGYGVSTLLLATTNMTISDSITNTTNQLLSVGLQSVGIVLLVLFAFIPLVATAAGLYAALVARLILADSLYVFFAALLVLYLFNEKMANRGISMLVKTLSAYFVFQAGFGLAILITTLLSTLPGNQSKFAAIVVLIVFLMSIRKLIDWSISLPSAISGGITSLRDKAQQKGKERFDKSALGRNLAMRKQGRESARQKRFLSQAASGEGLTGRMLATSNRMRNPLSRVSKEAQADYLEQLQTARQEMQDKRINTMKTAVTRDAGIHYASLLAQMNKGESVAAFNQRRQVPKAQGGMGLSALTGDQVTELEYLAPKFGNQLGTADFRKGALMSAHEQGADVEGIRDATGSLVKQLQADGLSDREINNVMGGQINQSAKAGGIYSLAGAGIDSATGDYDRYGIKKPGAVLKSANFDKFEGGQLGDLGAAPTTTNAAGQTVVDWGAVRGNEDYKLGVEVNDILVNGSDTDRAAMLQRIAQAGKNNSKAYGDLSRIANEAGRGQELQDVIKGFQ